MLTPRLSKFFKTHPAALAFVQHFCCGLAIALGLPSFSFIVVAALGLAVLGVLCHDVQRITCRQAAWRGLAFGLGYFTLALHWIAYAFFVDADAFLWMMPFAVGGLAVLMAVFWAVAFAGAWLAITRGMPPWLAVALGLSLAELLREFVLTGFPWAAPGLLADGLGPIAQVASVVGMPGLTALVLVWGMAPGVLWVRRRHDWRSSAVPAFLLAGCVLSFMWGQNRLSQHKIETENPRIVRLVQPNISANDKWRTENTRAIFAQLLQLTASESKMKPGVVVWPEAAVPFLLDEEPRALAAIADVLQPGQVLVTGAIRREASADDPTTARYFTSILKIDDEGHVLDHYDKWRLVPGGEFLPLAWALEPLGFRKVVNVPESFDPGQGPKAFEFSGFGAAALLICYEAIFPDRVIPQNATVQWIINVTNDGWFGASTGPYQHAAQVRLRAIEQGLPIARAANTGISIVYDGVGQTVAALDLGKTGFVDAALPNAEAATPFRRTGVWGSFIFILLLGTIASYGELKLIKRII